MLGKCASRLNRAVFETSVAVYVFVALSFTSSPLCRISAYFEKVGDKVCDEVGGSGVIQSTSLTQVKALAPRTLQIMAMK